MIDGSPFALYICYHMYTSGIEWRALLTQGISVKGHFE
jgi:hypothetical protein